MTTKPATVSMLTLMLALSLSPGSATAGIKCWTNSEGVKECGNVVPPEYSQEGHSEVSEQGITTGTTDRAKTTEELAAEKQALVEQEARKKVAAKQAAYERVLLDTFTTEDDLLLARDGKLAAIDTRILHTQQIATGLEEKLGSLEEEAANQERAGGTLDEELLGDIAALQSQIEQNSMFIVERQNEKESLSLQFVEDLARYRELKGI
jgi:hypothetical protein